MKKNDFKTLTFQEMLNTNGGCSFAYDVGWFIRSAFKSLNNPAGAQHSLSEYWKHCLQD